MLQIIIKIIIYFYYNNQRFTSFISIKFESKLLGYIKQMIYTQLKLIYEFNKFFK